MKKWEMNDHVPKKVSCVYVIIMFDFGSLNFEIAYVGSTIDLYTRYKSHKIPNKIQQLNKINLLYYKQMDKGFYDYELKLIKKLQPIFNKQHK